MTKLGDWIMQRYELRRWRWRRSEMLLRRLTRVLSSRSTPAEKNSSLKENALDLLLSDGLNVIRRNYLLQLHHYSVFYLNLAAYMPSSM